MRPYNLVVDQVNSATLQFLEWALRSPRTYGDVMEAWRSTCPRLSVWEDALDAGLIEIEGGPELAKCAVILTPRGRSLIESSAKR
jgi:hypothetical protein